LWDIKGAFLTSVTFGDLKYDESAAMMDVQLAIEFDNCIFQF
jgi:hypothetical protein